MDYEVKLLEKYNNIENSKEYFMEFVTVLAQKMNVNMEFRIMNPVISFILDLENVKILFKYRKI